MYGRPPIDPRQMQRMQPELGADIGVNVVPPQASQVSDAQAIQMLLQQMSPQQQEMFKRQLMQYIMQQRGI
tara:strand:+ start:8982 stop:9194 length:213 start_codon:yes stop_codon:yes gene_type:complete